MDNNHNNSEISLNNNIEPYKNNTQDESGESIINNISYT